MPMKWQAAPTSYDPCLALRRRMLTVCAVASRIAAYAVAVLWLVSYGSEDWRAFAFGTRPHYFLPPHHRQAELVFAANRENSLCALLLGAPSARRVESATADGRPTVRVKG